MSNTLSKLFIFATGAAVGSVVTLCLVRAKYEKMTLDEIRSIRKLYEPSGDDDYVEVDDLDDEEDDGEEDDEPELDEATVKEYSRLVTKYNRTSTDVNPKKENVIEIEKEDDKEMKPYVIPPEEFDENGYDTVSLYWYEDGVVTYALGGEVVAEEDIDDLIGEDSPNHFGEYEDDTVYIRNDMMMTDFELCRDGRKYSEVK